MPIEDAFIPDQSFEARCPAKAKELAEQLRRGGSLFVLCMGGVGRTGLVAATSLPIRVYRRSQLY